MTIEQDLFAAELEEIRTTSRALNAAGDAATDEIEALESRLIEVEPGVTAWGAEILSEETELADDDSGQSQPAKRSVTVGFGRRKKKWGLLVREVMAVKAKPRDRDFGVVVSDEVTALRKADRQLRMLALPELGGVVQAVLAALREQAEQFLPPEEDEAADLPTDLTVDEGSDTPVEELDTPTVQLGSDVAVEADAR